MSDMDRLVPQNLEAEMSLIGSLLIDKEAMVRVGDAITPEDFYADKHKDIFEAICDLYRRHDPIDILSLSNRLEEKKLIEAIGGRAYLIQLSNAVPTSSHAPHYAQIVQKKATLRRLLYAAPDISALGYEEAEDVEQVLDKAEQKLFNVSQKFLKVAFTPITTSSIRLSTASTSCIAKKASCAACATGYADLDSMLGGLQKSDLIMLAARPSCGKDVARARHRPQRRPSRRTIPVGIFSLEMSKEQLVDRMLCAEADVDLWKMRTGRLSEHGDDDDFYAHRPRHRHAVRSADLHRRLGHRQHHGNPHQGAAPADGTWPGLGGRRLPAAHGIAQNGSDNRVQEISEITRGLKSIARELNIPVLALSQLSRAVELQKPAIPSLAHLRESGSIEQDADIVSCSSTARPRTRTTGRRTFRRTNGTWPKSTSPSTATVRPAWSSSSSTIHAPLSAIWPNPRKRLNSNRHKARRRSSHVPRPRDWPHRKPLRCHRPWTRPRPPTTATPAVSIPIRR